MLSAFPRRCLREVKSSGLGYDQKPHNKNRPHSCHLWMEFRAGYRCQRVCHQGLKRNLIFGKCGSFPVVTKVQSEPTHQTTPHCCRNTEEAGAEQRQAGGFWRWHNCFGVWIETAFRNKGYGNRIAVGIKRACPSDGDGSIKLASL